MLRGMGAAGKDNVKWWMTAAGIAIVAGFFLPLLEYHGLELVSGWDILWSSRAEMWHRLLLAGVPILGAGLAVTSLAGTTSAKWFSLGAGGLIIVYPTIKLVGALVEVAGVGAFLILGGGMTALVCGLIAAAKK